MIIKQTVVTEKELDLRLDTATGLYVEYTETPEQADYVENPFEGTEVSYHMPYNWTDSADFGDGDTLEDLLKEALDNARPEEQVAFFKKWFAETDDAENIEEVLEDYEASYIYDNNTDYRDDFSGDYLTAIAKLINEYTDSKVYSIYVYTHSGSSFSRGNSFSDAYLIAPKAMDTITIEYLLDAFTDYANGAVYSFTAYATIEDAKKGEDPTLVTVYGSNINEFEAGLIEELEEE